MKSKVIYGLIITLTIISFCQLCKAETTSDASLLNVTGHGESKAKPDIASLNIGASSKGKTANEATNLNATITQKLIDALRRAGIAENDIQTSSLSIFPIFKQPRPGDINDLSDVSRIIGYEVSNNINVTIRKIDDIGQIIDTVALTGNYTVNGPNFGLDKDETFEAEALRKAVSDARRKADIVASASGKAITGIKTITVGGSIDNPFKIATGAASESFTQVLPGQLTVNRDVSIQYTLDK